MLMLRNSGVQVRQALLQEEYRQVDPETARAILELMDVRDPEDKLNKCENAKGRTEGLASNMVRSIECAMRNFHVNLQVACENLGTTVEEYYKAKKITELV